MYTYNVAMNGWEEEELYTIEADSEGEAIAKAYKLADAPFASLIEIERES